MRIYIIFLGILFTVYSYGASITGKVLVNQNEPVGFTMIKCISLPDSLVVGQCIADSIGQFKVLDLKTGCYKLKCSQMGYEMSFSDSIVISTIDQQIQNYRIHLQQDMINLDEFVLLAEVSGLSESGKSVYKITDKLSNVAQTGVEILKYVPSIQVNLMQEVSVDGSSNIQYLIDGRKVSADEVKSLDAKKIAKVEVVHNPSAKYDADVSAVINIILKTDVSFGFSGKINTDTHYTNKTLSNSDIALEYGLKKWRFFIDAHSSLLDVDYTDKTSNVKENLDSYLKTGSGELSSKYTTINAGVDYKINKNNSLYYQFQYKPILGEQSTGDFETEYSQAGTLTGFTRTNIKSDDLSSSYKHYLFYKHAFSQAGHDISLTGEYSYRLQNIDNVYSESYYSADKQSLIGTQLRSYNTENKKDNIVFSADYSLPLSKDISMKMGYNLYSQFFNNTFNVSNASFDYNEYRNSFYFSYNHNIAKFNFQAGLRFEASDIELADSLNKTYYKLLPQASIQYKITDKQKIKLSYRRSISRPMIQYFNPFVEVEDSLHISKGNMDIDPAIEDKYELSYNGLLRASLYYRSFNDMFFGIVNLRNDGVYESMTANVASGYEYGLNFGGALPIKKWWLLNLSGSLYQQEINENTDYSIEARSNFAYRTSLSTMFQLPKSFSVSGLVSYASPYIYGQTTARPNVFYGVAVDKKFKSSLNLGLMWINPFSTFYNFKNETTYGNGFINTQKTAADIQYLINLRLTYTFNKGKKMDKQDKPKDSESEDGMRKFF